MTASTIHRSDYSNVKAPFSEPLSGAGGKTISNPCVLVTPRSPMLTEHHGEQQIGTDTVTHQIGDTTPYEHCIRVEWPGRRSFSSGERRHDWGRAPPWVGSLLYHGKDPSGQMYRRNRFYDPASGRFTQEDPIGIAGGLNVYGYAGGDPISYRDPFGLSADTLSGVDNESQQALFALVLVAAMAIDSEDPRVAEAGNALLSGLMALHNHPENIYVQVSTAYGRSFTGPRLDGPGVVSNVNPTQSAKRHITVRVAHELGHAYGMVINGATNPRNMAHRRQQNQNSLYFENNVRIIFGCPLRPMHGTDSDRQNPGCQP